MGLVLEAALQLPLLLGAGTAHFYVVVLFQVQLLARRQQKAIDLRRRTERVGTMTQQQLSELRSDIKVFVADRKIDEDLGRSVRFTYARNVLEQIIPNFGESEFELLYSILKYLAVLLIFR